MTTINWQFLLDNIENKQCILCLGPDFFTESGSEKRRYEQELSDFLRRHEKELRIRVYDNGWFHYLPGHNKLSVWKKLEEFYKQNNAEAAAILEKIADK